MRAKVALHLDPQEASRPGAPGSERILLDILEHDWREAQDSRQELCQKLHAVQGELQWAEELRDKVVCATSLHTPLPVPWPGEGRAGRQQFLAASLPQASWGTVLGTVTHWSSHSDPTYWRLRELIIKGLPLWRVL